jgi:hypothetical protein
MHDKWNESLDLAGIRHLGVGAWNEWSNKIGVIVNNLLAESQTKWRKKSIIIMKNNEGKEIEGFDVAIDCRWSSRGYNAEEGTVLCCSLTTNKVIYESHLMRNQGTYSGIILFLIFSFK